MSVGKIQTSEGLVYNDCLRYNMTNVLKVSPRSKSLRKYPGTEKLLMGSMRPVANVIKLFMAVSYDFLL
jgi:hypothetical protein